MEYSDDVVSPTEEGVEPEAITATDPAVPPQTEE